MKSFSPVLLLVLATAFAIDVDHDETDLGRGLYLTFKKVDASTVTPESIAETTKAYLEKNENVVKRLLTNGLNKEIIDNNHWTTWKEMAKKEASDVALKEGQLEALTSHLKETGCEEKASAIAEKAIEDVFNRITESLVKDTTVGFRHTLKQQEGPKPVL